MDQITIDNCIHRIRMARNVGLGRNEIIETLRHSFDMEIFFLSWHAACILDKFSIGADDTRPAIKTIPTP